MKQNKQFCVLLAIVTLLAASPCAFAVSDEGEAEIIDETTVPETLPTLESTEPEPELPTVSEPDPEPLPNSEPLPDSKPLPSEPESGIENEEPLPSPAPDDTWLAPLPAPEQPAIFEKQLFQEEDPLVIRVSVPNTGRIIVNPYGLETSLGQENSTEQIISPTLPITNYSNTAVSVSACAVGRASPEVRFVDAPPTLESQVKEVFLYLEFQSSPDGSANVAWENAFRDAPNQLAVTASETAKDDVLTLDAGNEMPTYGMFRLFGSTSAPLENMWTTQDQVDLTVSFTFHALGTPETQAFTESESDDLGTPDAGTLEWVNPESPDAGMPEWGNEDLSDMEAPEWENTETNAQNTNILRETAEP